MSDMIVEIEKVERVGLDHYEKSHVLADLSCIVAVESRDTTRIFPLVYFMHNETWMVTKESRDKLEEAWVRFNSPLEERLKND